MSGCDIQFRGKSDKRQIVKAFQALAETPTVVNLLITDIVDESADKFARGRFHLEFSNGDDFASIELYIEVKQ